MGMAKAFRQILSATALAVTFLASSALWSQPTQPCLNYLFDETLQQKMQQQQQQQQQQGSGSSVRDVVESLLEGEVISRLEVDKVLMKLNSKQVLEQGVSEAEVLQELHLLTLTDRQKDILMIVRAYVAQYQSTQSPRILLSTVLNILQAENTFTKDQAKKLIRADLAGI